jgi:hypothetical protein
VLVQYDPGTLQQFADDLYTQAKGIVFVYAAWYTLLTFAVAWFLIALLGTTSRGHIDALGALPWAAVIALVGLRGGIDAGRRKAFFLKLRAQQILCQREIELNTRKKDQATGTGR